MFIQMTMIQEQVSLLKVRNGNFYDANRNPK